MNQPTQQQLVEQTFLELLKQGHTTTLDVKNKLRKDYPNLTWEQNFVSTCCLEYQEESDNIGYYNNGTYRNYYLNTAPTAREYSYTANGVTIKANDWSTLLETSMKLGHNIHWSQNNQKFYILEEMDSHHLLNTIKLQFEETTFTPEYFVTWVKNSPYIQELISRY